MSETGFEVGSTHENEKGVYEVLSLDERKDTMVIKWESGEEVATAIGFQRRILERMKHDREVAKFGVGYNRRKGRSSGAKFDGFKETDFSGGVTGTTWRTQKALGGTVTALLNSDRPQIKSRAVSRMPQVHWTDPDRQPRDDNDLQAKLFVRLDKEYLYYGFYVERSDDKSRVQDDWHGFVEWLSDVKNESWLKEIMDEYGLCIYDVKDNARPFDGRIAVGDGNWRLSAGTAEQDVASLAGFLKELPDTAAVNLQIAKITAKDDALARAGEITGDISSLFATLMPLYRAAMKQAND
jgi:hypothetical protein